MIQITLRPIDGSSPSEERLQRPERPQRANRPPGNTSPLQSFIIRAHTGQTTSGREELPRPNAPVQDENYNNRSISPLFTNHPSSITSAANYQGIIGPQQSSTENPCEMQPSRPRVIDLEFTGSQTIVSSANPLFRNQSTSLLASTENNNQPTREDQHEQHRQRIWPGRNTTQGSNSVSERVEEHVEGNLVTEPRRIDRSPLIWRRNRTSNHSDEMQEQPTLTIVRSCHHQERERRIRMPRGFQAVPPPAHSDRPNATSRQNWEMWTGVGGLPRRPLRRENRSEHNVNEGQILIPPFINLVEDEQENPSTSGANTSNEPVLADPEVRWISLDMVPTSQLDNHQNVETRGAWAEEEVVTTEDNSIPPLVDEEERLLQQEEEEDAEDNEILVSVPPDANRDQQCTPPTPPNASASDQLSHRLGAGEDESQTRDNDIRQLVLSALECPVCFDYVAPPIAQCYQGHLVCKKCRLRLTQCPECRGPFSAVRPRAVEKIVTLLEFPCPNEGCSAMIVPSCRVLHAKSCNFRSFICPIAPTFCTWSGQKAAMRTHVLSLHGQRLHWINNPKLIFHIQPRLGMERVFIMETMGHLFLVKFIVAPQDKLRGCVTLLGYDESRRDGMHVLVLVQAERPGPFLMISRSPAEESDEMDMRLEKFAVFNISHLMNNALTQSSLIVKITIGRRDILRQLDRIFE